jgi:hypothetical protein
MTEAFQESLIGHEPGMAQLNAMGAAYRRFALEHTDIFRLIFGQLDAAYKPGEMQVEEGSRIFDMVTGVVQEAMDRGELAHGDARMAAMTIWALGHGCVMLEMTGMCEKCAPVDVDEVYQRAFETLFAGLRTSPNN